MATKKTYTLWHSVFLLRSLRKDAQHLIQEQNYLNGAIKKCYVYILVWKWRKYILKENLKLKLPKLEYSTYNPSLLENWTPGLTEGTL